MISSSRSRPRPRRTSTPMRRHRNPVEQRHQHEAQSEPARPRSPGRPVPGRIDFLYPTGATHCHPAQSAALQAETELTHPTCSHARTRAREGGPVRRRERPGKEAPTRHSTSRGRVPRQAEPCSVQIVRRAQQDVPDRRRVPLPTALRGRHFGRVQVVRDLAQRVALPASRGRPARPSRGRSWQLTNRPRPSRWCTRLSASSSPEFYAAAGMATTSSGSSCGGSVSALPIDSTLM